MPNHKWQCFLEPKVNRREVVAPLCSPEWVWRWKTASSPCPDRIKDLGWAYSPFLKSLGRACRQRWDLFPQNCFRLHIRSPRLLCYFSGGEFTPLTLPRLPAGASIPTHQPTHTDACLWHHNRASPDTKLWVPRCDLKAPLNNVQGRSWHLSDQSRCASCMCFVKDILRRLRHNP